MARGGKRQGGAGKAYSNRTDLNVDRAAAPGSSGTMPGGAPAPAVDQQAPPQRVLPDDIPNLSSPTNMPDLPMEQGIRNADPNMFGAPTQSVDSSLLIVALESDPYNPDLQRIRDQMILKGEL